MARRTSQEPSAIAFPYRTLGEDGSIIGADYRSLTAQVGAYGGGAYPPSAINPSPMGGAPGGGSPIPPAMTSFFNAQRIWDILVNNPLPSNCVAKPFVPGITGNDLGSTSQRWDLFARDIDMSGTLTLSAISPGLVLFSGVGGAVTAEAAFAYNSATDTLSVGAQVLAGASLGSGSPGFAFIGDTNTGMAQDGADTLSFATGGTFQWRITSAGHWHPVNTTNTQDIGSGSALVRSAYIGTSALLASAATVEWNADLRLSRAAAAVLFVSGAAGGIAAIRRSGGNGSYLSEGVATELVTIAASAFTDSTYTAAVGTVIRGVGIYVVTAIPTAATFNVQTDGGQQVSTVTNISTAAGSNDSGTAAGYFYVGAATKIRIIPDAIPAAATGQVRIVVYVSTVQPPTS